MFLRACQIFHIICHQSSANRDSPKLSQIQITFRLFANRAVAVLVAAVDFGCWWCLVIDSVPCPNKLYRSSYRKFFKYLFAAESSVEYENLFFFASSLFLRPSAHFECAFGFVLAETVCPPVTVPNEFSRIGGMCMLKFG